MQQIISRESLQRFYGKGVHFYGQGVEYQRWLIVPFISGQFSTTSCFDPKGKRYISWSQYLSTEEEIAVDCLFVLRRVREIASVY